MPGLKDLMNQHPRWIIHTTLNALDAQYVTLIANEKYIETVDKITDFLDAFSTDLFHSPWEHGAAFREQTENITRRLRDLALTNEQEAAETALDTVRLLAPILEDWAPDWKVPVIGQG